MLSEKIDLGIDIKKLRAQFETQILKLPITMQGRSFGGWSVTSTTGHYADDWVFGSFLVGESYNMEKVRLSNKPTEIYTGYIKEIIEEIAMRGFSPLRCRISLLKSHSQSVLHRDGADDQYMVRLHVPIITNRLCFFIANAEKVHLPADGSGYLLAVNKMHQVVNDGPSHRYHLMMDVWDTKKMSLHHQYTLVS